MSPALRRRVQARLLPGPHCCCPWAGGPRAVAGASGSSLAAAALCLLGSLALLAMQLGAVRHSRVPAGYALLFAAAYSAVVALAWSSLAQRRLGRVQWKGRTYEIERNTAPPSV
jgi:hypothetical protein